MGLLIIVGAIVFGVVCANMAEDRGRDRGPWFFMGLILGPFALIALLMMRKDEAAMGNVKCRFCAEYVKPEAVVCKHCGNDLTAPREGFGDTIPCLSCGHENPIAARRCENCGHSFAS